MNNFSLREEIKLRDSLWFNFKLLNTFGYWFPENAGKYKNIAYLVYSFIILNTTYFMYMVTEIINVILSIGDLEKITEASFLLLTHLVQTTKLYAFFKKRGAVLGLLKMLKSPLFQPFNDKQHKILKTMMVQSKLIYYIFLLMAVCTVSLWGAFPFLDKSESSYHLPLSAWYPFAVDKSPIFEVIFVYQILTVMINAATNISLDCLCNGFMAHVCGQLDILNDTLENLYQYVENCNESSSGNIYKENDRVPMKLQIKMDRLLKRSIIHHREIIKMSTDVSDIFGTSVFNQFICSTVIICITMFELTLVPLFSLRFFSMVLYQACMLMEIFLYCWYGNEILLKSNNISLSIYYSNWTNCSNDFKMKMLFLMTRTKIPIKIYAANMFSLSLETFSAVATFSFFISVIMKRMKTL